MKKTAAWILFIAFAVFIIDWGVMGIKLLDGNYNITTEAYIGAVCFAVIIICLFCRVLGNKCSHCGKNVFSEGEYCPYCGNKLK
ncbi:MAG: hypothetical protein E7489_00335 [Ruminococcaceae bacterium]|nr:hypothetical protein [Oscillospiraceae bacterium]MBQ3237298.1 hypothetical protein [Oscillospiraceae bacterium]